MNEIELVLETIDGEKGSEIARRRGNANWSARNKSNKFADKICGQTCADTFIQDSSEASSKTFL